MKKNLKMLVSVFLISGFLAACADGEDPEMEEPVAPDVPGEQLPEDGGGEVDPGTDTNGTDGTGTDAGDTDGTGDTGGGL